MAGLRPARVGRDRFECEALAIRGFPSSPDLPEKLKVRKAANNSQDTRILCAESTPDSMKQAETQGGEAVPGWGRRPAHILWMSRSPKKREDRHLAKGNSPPARTVRVALQISLPGSGNMRRRSRCDVGNQANPTPAAVTDIALDQARTDLWTR